MRPSEGGRSGYTEGRDSAQTENQIGAGVFSVVVGLSIGLMFAASASPGVALATPASFVASQGPPERAGLLRRHKNRWNTGSRKRQKRLGVSETSQLS